MSAWQRVIRALIIIKKSERKCFLDWCNFSVSETEGKGSYSGDDVWGDDIDT